MLQQGLGHSQDHPHKRQLTAAAVAVVSAGTCCSSTRGVLLAVMTACYYCCWWCCWCDIMQQRFRLRAQSLV
jgi:hypothetical protein